jgi:hypothetical protein
MKNPLLNHLLLLLKSIRTIPSVFRRRFYLFCLCTVFVPIFALILMPFSLRSVLISVALFICCVFGCIGTVHNAVFNCTTLVGYCTSVEKIGGWSAKKLSAGETQITIVDQSSGATYLFQISSKLNICSAGGNYRVYVPKHIDLRKPIRDVYAFENYVP